MSTMHLLPNGALVCLRHGQRLAPDEEAALVAITDAAVRAEENRRAALTDDEWAAEDERRRIGRERLQRAQRRAREDR